MHHCHIEWCLTPLGRPTTQYSRDAILCVRDLPEATMDGKPDSKMGVLIEHQSNANIELFSIHYIRNLRRTLATEIIFKAPSSPSRFKILEVPLEVAQLVYGY